jgi:hypothetical protein
MRHAEINPYRDATFGQLGRACSEAIREFEERRQRTREEKEAFAKQLRFLLIAIAMRLSNGATIPDSPEMTLSRANVCDVEAAFFEWYERTLRDEAAAIRVMTLNRAADFVLREGGALWVNPGLPVPGRVRPIDHATTSEDALRQCLRSLGDLLTTRG